MSTQMSVQTQALPGVKTKTAVEASTQSSSRLLYVDNLRVFLTILVVVHHLAITYGASGSWFYSERPSTMLAEILLTMFTGLNQFYFMGLFFMIAGYFVPGAVDRKGAWQFMKDRLVRLGIPFLLFVTLVSPIIIYVSGVYQGWWSESLREFLAGYWQRIGLDSGPLWFVETLLVFSAVYVLGRAILSWLKPNRENQTAQPVQKQLTHGRIIAFILVLAPASIAVRLVAPIDTTWHNLQLAFFPQYILLFSAGILAYRQNWLTEIPDAVRRVWSKVALAAIAVMPLMMAAVMVFGGGDLNQVKGGLTVFSIFTAIWESVYCIAMPILLLSVFRRRLDFQGRLSQFLSRNAYTVYIIHAPVIVFTAILFRNLAIDPLLKFVLVAPLGVALCFLISHFLVRRLPLADRVL